MPASRLNIGLILAAGCLISLIGFGIRSIFGLFLEPVSNARGWERDVFSLALAIQYFLWGLALPLASAFADRFGAAPVIALGAILFALGTWGIGVAGTPFVFQLVAGGVLGFGVAFTAFTLALAAMTKSVQPRYHSLVLGIGTAAGSLGMFLFSPFAQSLIGSLGWRDALFWLAVIACVMAPLAFLLPSAKRLVMAQGPEQTVMNAVQEAYAHRGYVLLTLGFFVCGFHVAFIAVHFPAFLKDEGLGDIVGAHALALVGLFNIGGSLVVGVIGNRWAKKYSLSTIYFARAIVMMIFVLAPKTVLNVYLFSAIIGFLWLSTVPLTSGIIAQVFGTRYFTLLSGLIFVSHQAGSFLGIWLGGFLYRETGSYDMMWWSGVILGFVAFVLHLPINETPLRDRLQPAQT